MVLRKKWTKDELDRMQEVYEAVLCSVHNIRRALSLNRNGVVKSLGEDVYPRLVALEDAAKQALRAKFNDPI